MGLFSKPKKKKLAVGKGTHAEEAKAEYNTRKKYPQMFKDGWGKPKKATPKKKKKADTKSAATKLVQSRLAEAGVSMKDMPSDVDKRKGKK